MPLDDRTFSSIMSCSEVSYRKHGYVIPETLKLYCLSYS